MTELRSTDDLGKWLARAIATATKARRALVVLEHGDGMTVAGARLPRGEKADALLQAITPWLHEARRARAVRLRHGPHGAARADRRSCLVAPLVEARRVLGYLYADIDGRFGRFAARDRDMLAMLARQAIVTLAGLKRAQALEIDVAKRSREASDAQQRQTATAEILKVIAGSPADVQPVLDAIAASAHRLFGRAAALQVVRDGMLHLGAIAGFSTEGAQQAVSLYPMALDASSRSVRALRERRVLETTDILAPGTPPAIVAIGHAAGFRSIVTVPLLRGDNLLGQLSLTANDVRPRLDERQLGLLNTFADQAVIAIENARLFKETNEALERQAATADILGAMSDSMTDTTPVFDAIARSCSALFKDSGISLRLVRDGLLEPVANIGFPAGAVPVDRGSVLGACVLEGRSLHLPDLDAAVNEFPRIRQLGLKYGYHSGLYAPMMQGGVAIGAIAVLRPQKGAFGDKEIEVLETFADQAVIAIENARLFKALDARNRDLTESLEQQTATAEILKIISESPTDVQPVFDAIVRAGGRLFEGAGIALARPIGNEVCLAATAEAHAGSATRMWQRFPIPLDHAYMHSAAILDGRMIDVPDATVMDGHFDVGKQNFLASGNRAITIVPMMNKGAAIGTISVVRETPGALSDKQIALLHTFADQAVIAIENTRLFTELETRNAELTVALEQQTATGEILRVIASTTSDLQPVFQTIVDSAVRLCDGAVGGTMLFDGELIHLAAHRGLTPEGEVAYRRTFPLRPTRANLSGRAIVDRTIVHVPDVEADASLPISQALHDAQRWRAALSVPMLRDGQPIGAISVARLTPGPFSDRQIALMQAFADQAVIAIENARLFNQTKEALERQTATAEILKIIARSPDDVQPVFEAIARSAAQLFGSIAGILIREGDAIDLKAYAAFNMSPEDQDRSFAQMKQLYPMRFDFERNMNARAMATLQADECSDTEAEDVSEIRREHARRGGYRSYYTVPLIREGTGIGVVSIAFAQRGVRLTDAQRTLLRTFADQAVIAIENVRLFNATKEALEHQTAAAEVLQVISGSVSDTAPVFDKIIRSCEKLFGVRYANVALLGDDGMMRMVQDFASSDLSEAEIASRKAVQAQFPRPARDSIHGYAIHKREVLHYPDVVNGPGVPQGLRASVTLPGGAGVNYSALYAPMMWEGKGIGAIGVHRFPPAPFADKDIRLLKTFADQAAIAIENARLFNETKEALERQTATAEILKVIASSPSDVQPVFDAIVESAARLFGRRAALRLIEADGLRRRALSDVGSAQFQGEELIPIDQDSLAGRVVLERRAMQVVDTRGPDAPPFAKSHAHKWNFRSVAAAPLVRDGKSIGMISVNSPEPGALSDKQMELLGTFADQAVIAIQNAQLFKELQSRTEALTKSVGQLTALGEVGQAISSSLDLETVLRTIASRAVQLSGVDAGSIYEYDEQAEVYRLQAAERMAPELVEAVRRMPIRKGDGATGRTAETLEPVQVPDILDDSYHGSRKDNLARTGYRAVLAVPLLREGHLLGALQVFRRTPGPFAPEVVELLKTFATQSAMAIQNARLFREIAEKGKQLEQASRHKSQFLASMSHELRTPLNAILGLNEMLLGEIYGEVPEDMKPPLVQTQASGRHLLGLINNVLDLAKIEANRLELVVAPYVVQDLLASVRATLAPLAAEKGLAFTASAPDDLPVAHGDAGRLTQCLINLAGNAVKFTKEGRVELRVEPVEDRLRFSVTDTGIGIAPDKIGDLFTEFKQTDATIAREYGGTGLGLAITRKFIELHKGSIWVESELGRGSTFIFEIPLQAQA